MPRTKKVTIHAGLKFRYHYADSNPLWEVKTPKGRGCWVCEITNEKIVIDGKEYDGDYAGVQKVFSNEEIAACVGQENFWQSLRKQTENFYDKLTVGQIVHYDNGFKQFVRCRVIEEGGEKKFLPIALCGEWRDYDLPKRYPDGTPNLPYHVRKIIEKDAWQPNDSCVVESPTYGKRREITAAQAAAMPEIDLTLPPMTERETAVAVACKWRDKVAKELDKVADPETLETFKSFIRGQL